MSKNLSDIFPPTEIGGGGGGIEEAPKTGKMYARKDADWEEFDPGQLETGNQDGEILTWDTATAKWVDNDTVIVKGGNVGIGIGSNFWSKLTVSDSAQIRTDGSDTPGTPGLYIGNTNGGGVWRMNTGYGVALDTYNSSNAWQQSLLISRDGNVGINTDAPDSFGSDFKAITVNGTKGGAVSFTRGTNSATKQWSLRTSDHDGLIFENGATNVERMRIDSQGRVGIGGTPSRSTKEIEEEEESTLRNWDSKDKKPTKAELIKQLTERTIGGGSAKLQVAGGGYFSGDVTAFRFNTTGGVFNSTTTGGYLQIQGVNQVQWDTAQMYPATDGGQSLGTFSYRWKDAHFSGTIYGKVADVPDHVKAITPTQIANWDAGTGGGGGGATTDGRISDTQIIHWDQAYSWGDHKSAGYQPAGNYLTPSSLTGYATESWVTSNYQPAGNYETAGTAYTKAESDAKYELKGAGGLPAGDWHCTGSITAAGNITAYSTSDERLKDDIAPMPLGLIDGIAPATFKWKDSGKSSGGVIAQQLQACGLGDWVNEAPNGDLGVDQMALIGVLLAEVQDLKARVKELEG